MKINDNAPNFTAQTTHGEINFHEWLNNEWCVFVSHPKDFTPICTTEIGLMATMENEFAKRGIKLIAHSADTLEEHFRWTNEIESYQGTKPTFPLIADYGLEIAKLYEMLPAEEESGSRTPMQNASVRAVFIIDSKKKIRAMTFYPATAGRSFVEILRLVDSLQLTDKYSVATPVNWHLGDCAIILPAISDQQAKDLFPNGWTLESPIGLNSKSYLRYVKVG
jgi:alkyl hydroperoxide reductase subunit AhpC